MVKKKKKKKNAARSILETYVAQCLTVKTDSYSLTYNNPSNTCGKSDHVHVRKALQKVQGFIFKSDLRKALQKVQGFIFSTEKKNV